MFYFLSQLSLLKSYNHNINDDNKYYNDEKKIMMWIKEIIFLLKIQGGRQQRLDY